jgi:hypothetical protein
VFTDRYIRSAAAQLAWPSARILAMLSSASVRLPTRGRPGDRRRPLDHAGAAEQATTVRGLALRLRRDVEVVRLVQGADTGVAVPGPSTSTTPPDPSAVAWTALAMRSVGLAATQPAAGQPASLPPPVALGARGPGARRSPIRVVPSRA